MNYSCLYKWIVQYSIALRSLFSYWQECNTQKRNIWTLPIILVLSSRIYRGPRLQYLCLERPAKVGTSI